MGALQGGFSTAQPRTAIFVDYENVYYHDKRAYGPEGIARLAGDLMMVAGECGPVTVAEAIAPFDEIPGAADAFHDAGFDPVFSPGGKIANAADLKVVQRLMGLDERQGIGIVVLVSGDQHMLGAIREAQSRGLLALVVSCGDALSRKLEAAADRVLLVKDVQAEAFRLRRGTPPQLGLREWVTEWRKSRTPTDSGPEDGERSGELPGGPGMSRTRTTVGTVTVVETAAAEPEPVPETLPGGRVFTSPSALKLYVQCPRRYARVFIEGHRERPSPASFVGTVVHQALKVFYGLAPAERTWDALEGALRKAWACSPERAGVFADVEDEAAAGREALADLKVFYQKADRRLIPFEREVFLTTEVGEGVTVRGKVDRIDETPKGLVIIDYKTGKLPPQKPNLIDDFQLPLYHAMVDEAYSRPVEKVTLHYLKGNVRYDFVLDDGDVERAKNRALDLVRQIRADTEHLPRVSPLCRFCSFLADCPARADVETRYFKKVEPTGTEGGDLPF